MTQLLPWVDLADGNTKTGSNVLNGLVALRDDSYTFSDGFGGDGVISCYHNDLRNNRNDTLAKSCSLSVLILLS